MRGYSLFKGTFMDYSKIKLENERNAHVTKRLNRLKTWGFFKVLYRDNIWRLFGFSLLMLVCLAPIFVVQVMGSFNLAKFNQTLPNNNGFGFSSGVWTDLSQYYATYVSHHNIVYGLLTVAASILAFVVISGGFGVIRDAFWTGKFSTVGVFKSLGLGIAAGWYYALASVVIIAFSLFGIITFYPWAATVMPVWLAIVITVILSILLFLVCCYLMILCSVAVTYKQSFATNLGDAWRLMWLNFLPNILHLMLALLPLPLYFIFSTSMLQSIFMVLILMFGGLYFPLVWHTYMMRTFALFHPVQTKPKKKATNPAEIPVGEDVEIPDEPVAETQPTDEPAATDEPQNDVEPASAEPQGGDNKD